ncbi:ABC transporter permease [bacterium]|nr:ABC transporter permease [bacterium]
MNGAVILALVRLRLVRVLRDRMGLVWLLVMPMVFSFLMGELMGGMNSGGGTRALPRFLVADADGTVAVDRLLAPLLDNERFRVVREDTNLTVTEARAAVENGRHTAVLIVPQDFGARVAAGERAELTLAYDSDRLSSQTVRTTLEQAVLRTNAEAAARSLVAAPGGPVPRDRAAAFDAAVFDSLWTRPRVSLEATTLGRVEDDDWGLTRSHQHVGPAYVLFFVMMFLMMTAKELVQARRDRTLDRLVTSRARSGELVLGIFLGGMAIGLVQAAVLLVLNSLAFGIDYGDSPLGLALTVLLFAAFAAGASIVLGAVARTEAQADGLGMALTMTMAALGGLWWPLEIVPAIMQRVGHALPTGQAITCFHDMIGRGYGLADLAPLLVGLGVWAGAALLLGAWRLRRLVTGA